MSDKSSNIRNAARLIIRGDGSFNADPKGDWVSARHFDEALAEIERLRDSLREAWLETARTAAEGLRAIGAGVETTPRWACDRCGFAENADTVTLRVLHCAKCETLRRSFEVKTTPNTTGE